MKYVNSFRIWALQQYNEYQQKSEHIKAKIDITLRKCVCIDFERQKIAFSKCHPDDQFNPEIGIGVAYAKLMGREIPQELKTIPITDLKHGQRFRLKTQNGTICRQEFSFIGASTDKPTTVVCEEYHKSGSTLCYIQNHWEVVVID